MDDETAAKAAAQDAKVQSDRKASAMTNALEEARTMLEQADHNRRTLEQELCDTNEGLADLSNQNQAIAASKRKLEADLNTLNVSRENKRNNRSQSLFVCLLIFKEL